MTEPIEDADEIDRGCNPSAPTHSASSSEPVPTVSGKRDRGALAEVLFIPDLCAVLGGISPSAARRAVHRGECGPYLEFGRRLAVLRDSFLAALKAREVTAAPATTRPLPTGVERFAELLRGRRKKQRVAGTHGSAPGTGRAE